MAKVSGPPPQAVRRRRNKDENAPVVQGQRRGQSALSKPVGPNPDWRQDVRNYFTAAMNSGQSDWYETSDIMTLYIHCELLDRVLRQTRTVPLYEQELKGDKWVDVLDEDGNRIPMLDQYGEPDRRVVGSLNGQALKAVIDMNQDLLITEGARRKLRIDLGFPKDESEAPEKALIAAQRKRVAVVK